MTDLERAVTILADVADEYMVPVSDVIGRSRRVYLTEPRRIATARIWQQTSLTLSQIGALLGGRDHSTVAHHLRVYELRDRAA